MNVTHGLRRALQINAGGIATRFGDRQRTWAEVGDRVARFAGALRAMGIGAGDRVGVLMLNQDRYLELYLAVAWAGAVIVPVTFAGARRRSRIHCATAARWRWWWMTRSPNLEASSRTAWDRCG